MKIHLDDMSWPEVEEMLRRPHALLIPVGSVEQHGPHLPISVDSRCADYMAAQAARKVAAEHQIAAAVAPTIAYAEVNTFAAFPGSIGISLDTQTRLIGDIVRSCVKQGFKNIILVKETAKSLCSALNPGTIILIIQGVKRARIAQSAISKIKKQFKMTLTKRQPSFSSFLKYSAKTGRKAAESPPMIRMP